MNSLVECSLVDFSYANGRQGFLAKFPDGRELAVTNNLDGIEPEALIFRTYGESEGLAKSLLEAFFETGNYTKLPGGRWVGLNKVEILYPKLDKA